MNRLRRQRILLVTLGTLWSGLWPVLPDLAIYWTLGNFLKPLVTINLPQSPQFLGNICKGVKIYHFFLWNNFWASFIDIWRFLSGHTDCGLTILGLMGGARTDRLLLAVWPVKKCQISIKVAQKLFPLQNWRFRHLYKNCLRMWDIWTN